MQQAFIIRAFNTKKDSSGKEIDFERIHRELIAPALDAAGLGGGTTGKIIDAGNIREDMFGLITRGRSRRLRHHRPQRQCLLRARDPAFGHNLKALWRLDFEALGSQVRVALE